MAQFSIPTLKPVIVSLNLRWCRPNPHPWLLTWPSGSNKLQSVALRLHPAVLFQGPTALDWNSWAFNWISLRFRVSSFQPCRPCNSAADRGEAGISVSRLHPGYLFRPRVDLHIVQVPRCTNFLFTPTFSPFFLRQFS